MTRARRLVLMQIAHAEDAEQVREVHSSFEAIPGVRCVTSAQSAHARVGDPSFTHVSIFEFADAATRAAYHDHPLHVAAHHDVRSRTTNVVVVDLD